MKPEKICVFFNLFFNSGSSRVVFVDNLPHLFDEITSNDFPHSTFNTPFKSTSYIYTARCRLEYICDNSIFKVSVACLKI